MKDGPSPIPIGSSRRLDSWKEIAQYLGREVRTVQRWERDQALPVHRHVHRARSSVYAFTAELDVWWTSRAPALEDGPAEPAPTRKRSRNIWIAGGTAALLICVVVGWAFDRARRQRWALETATPEIARLIDTGEYLKATEMAREARAVLPNNPTLESLWTRVTSDVKLATQPGGAEVSIRPYDGDPTVWRPLGKTPVQARVPRMLPLVWRFTKPGIASSLVILRARIPSGTFPVMNLRPEASVPPEMVVVGLGKSFKVGLGYPLAQAASVQITGFLIDRHEVTNREFKKFVDSGGYQKREFWKQTFVKDGSTIPWEEAINLFRDSTGRSGPSTWEAGGYPKGHEEYPVAGVSWYEAGAYAEFAGKTLPTAYHWTFASGSGDFAASIVPGSNFGTEGTRQTGSGNALSQFGTTDMAGNVKEWCLNETKDTKRLILGGGFGEPAYMFTHTDAQSPWERRANFGFRCVKLDSPASPAAAARIDEPVRDYWKERPVSDEVFNAYKTIYTYDKGDVNAQVEEAGTSACCSRQKVTLDAAYGHERLPVYLFLPKNSSPPFQAIVNFPGANFESEKLNPSALEDSFDYLLKSGRAVIAPTFKGFYERRDGFDPGHNPPVFFRDHVIAWAKDLGRTLDYIDTRKDFDHAKIAYFGFSLGGVEVPIFMVTEKRIKAAIISNGGFQLRRDLPEVDPFNFVTHVTTPVLMISGRFDSTFPLEPTQNSLFQLLATPERDKRHVIYEDGHGAFPRPAAVRACLDWLDKYLGKVQR